MADAFCLQDDGDNSNDVTDLESDMQQNYLEPGPNSTNQFDFLPPMLRLEKHAFSPNAFHRQLVGRLILETLPVIADNPSDVNVAMAIAFQVANDTDAPVRAELMEQVPHITMLCHEDRDRLHYVIEMSLLPLVVKFLSDSDSQVRKMSQAALLVMMEQGLLEEAAIEKIVCPVVLRLTELERQVEYFTGAIVLMGKMAPLLGKAKTKELFVARFAALCSDPVFIVRKACASSIGEICAVLGLQATEELLLDSFLGLCQDDVWGVKKACAEVFLSIACTCSLNTRKVSLAPVFYKLLTDNSQWVRMAAFCVLGPFISTFAEPAITGLAYNHIRELVLVNPQGAEFRFCTSKGIDADAMVKYFNANPSCISQNYGFYEDVQSLDLDHTYAAKPTVSEPNSISVISNEAADALPADVESDTNKDIHSEEIKNVQEDKTGVGGVGELVNCDQGDDVIGDQSPLTSTVNTKTVSELESKPELEDCTAELHLDGELSLKSNNKDMPIINSIDKSSIENSITNYMECDNLDKEVVRVKDALPTTNEEVTVFTECNDHETSNIPVHTSKQPELTTECQVPPQSQVESYNTFQYWRVPIPEITLELLSLPPPTPPPLPPPPPPASFIFDIDDLDIDMELEELEGLIETFSISSSSNQQCTSPTTVPYKHQRNSSNASITIVPEHSAHKSNSSNHSIQVAGNKNGKAKNRHREQNVIPQELLDSFLSMTHPSQAQATDNEIAHHCAFSFPAVAHTLGRAHWPLLKFAYEALASDMHWKVRRTVASSIHELAWILGEELAAKDLVPIFNGFIKDLDEVRIGALKHLSDFLKVLRREQRDSYLPRLSEFLLTDSEWNWRFRAALAEQLSLSVPLFAPSDARKYLAPLATSLLLDKVSAVRQMALALVCGLVCRSTSEPILLRNLLAEVAEQFAHSKRWSRRQVFVLLCTRLIALEALPNEEFARNVLPHLLDLSWDPVANVRLAVARTLATTLLNHRYFSSEDSPHLDLLLQILKRLQNDVDRDVRFYASPAMQSKWTYDSSTKKITLPQSAEGNCIRH